MVKIGIFAFLFILFPIFPVWGSSDMEILIVPVGTLAHFVTEDLCQDLKAHIPCQPTISKSVTVPQFTYNSKRGQYYAEAILDEIIKNKRTNTIVLGIIDKDLYVHGLNFVFGIADPTRKSALISITRLRESFYRLPENHNVLRKRVITEAIHELGHVLGLGHCQNPKCVMFFSNSLKDTDRKGPHFCTNCKAILQKRQGSLK
jgi:archaemetzincin